MQEEVTSVEDEIDGVDTLGLFDVLLEEVSEVVICSMILERTAKWVLEQPLCTTL